MFGQNFFKFVLTFYDFKYFL